MIMGSIDIDHDSVNTHRDSYLLDSISVVAVRRPFFGVAGVYTVGFGGFGISFYDLLYAHELAAIFVSAYLIALAGWKIGQLKLLSKDLRGSELSDVVWGDYNQLNQVRLQIAQAMRLGKTGVQS